MAEDYSGYRVLIADDNAMQLEVLLEMASSLGVTCESASDGNQALEMLKASPIGYYNLFISDIFMPGLKGYEVALKFRTSGREDALKLPIIGVSANTDPQLYEVSISSGMSSMTLKPIAFPTLSAYFTLFLKNEHANKVFSAQLQSHIDAERRMHDYVMTLSQNIRTPLTAILEFGEMLQAGGLESGDVTNFAEAIVGAGRQIYKTINDAQLEFGETEGNSNRG